MLLKKADKKYRDSIKDQTYWAETFAWLPVRTMSGVVWLERVEFRHVLGMACRQYRRIKRKT